MKATEPEFIGDRIKRLREARGLSQAALRRASHVSPTTIYRAEVAGVVSERTAVLLAKALGVQPGELLP